MWDCEKLDDEEKQIIGTDGMKALKCKTLGGIHIHHALSHIEQQVPRTFHTHNGTLYIDRLCILRMRVRVRVGPLACFTPVAPVASL